VTRTIDYGERGTVVVVADNEELAQTAASLVKQTIDDARTRNPKALIALSGGSTPKRMGQILAAEPYTETVAWSDAEIFWGDERWVPLESSESNAGEAMRGFLDHVRVPRSQIHPFAYTDSSPEASAEEMEATIATFGDGETPRFSLILLGMGDDGHTASLFPGTPAIHESTRLVVSNRVDKLDTTRLTFTPALINAAHQVTFLAGGAGKADMLHNVLDGPVDVDLFPSQVVRPIKGSLTWIIDEAAAANLDRNSHG
jgi:6-phosphogluconolactonase